MIINSIINNGMCSIIDLIKMIKLIIINVMLYIIMNFSPISGL